MCGFGLYVYGGAAFSGYDACASDIDVGGAIGRGAGEGAPVCSEFGGDALSGVLVHGMLVDGDAMGTPFDDGVKLIGKGSDVDHL